jgi:hypothetical protein
MPLEDRLQSLAVSLEQGLGRVVLQGILFVALVGAVFSAYALTQFRGLRDGEAMECAQLARNLAQGRGFTTGCVRPGERRLLSPDGSRPAPPARVADVRHAPLYPALLALGFKLRQPSFAVSPAARLFPPESQVVVPLGMLLCAGTGGLVFLTGQRLFGRRTGWWALLIFLVTDAVLADSLSGTSVPLLMFLTTAAFYTALLAVFQRGDERHPFRWLLPFVLTAALCALAFLAGYSLIVLVPALVPLWVAASARWRWTPAFAFILLFALAVAPWLLRNQRLSGSWLGSAPAAAVRNSVLYPADSFDRQLRPQINSYQAARALRLKLRTNVLRLFESNLALLGSGLILCFFLASFCSRFEQDLANVSRWGLGLGLALMLLIAAAGDGDAARQVRAFLPLVVLYGTAFLFVVLERTYFLEPGAPLVLPWIVLLLTALPAFVRVTACPARAPYPPYFPPFIAYACDLLEPGEMLCTDMPWATAWYGNRTSLLLPQTVDDFQELKREGWPLNGLYLTQLTGSPAGPSAADRSWQPVMRREVPEGFPLTNGIAFPPGTRDQLFLTDRVRWKQQASGLLAEDALEVRPTDRSLTTDH